MINIDIRDRNTLITLSSPGKSPIIASSGSSPSFYNAMELLCISYAACYAKHLVRYCMEHDIQVKSFQQLSVSMEDGNIILYIKHSKKLDTEKIKDIHDLATTCDIYKSFLKCKVQVHMDINEENFIERESKTNSCCGN